MAKKVVRLTEGELSALIRDITMSVLNEADKETYARLWAASGKAQEQLQNGSYQEKLGEIGRVRDNDCKYDRVKEIEKEVLASALVPHKETKYMFFTKSGRDFGCRVIFKLNSAPKIKDSEIILDGTIIFNREARYGKIHIQDGKAVYIKGKFHYVLEPDNRTKPAWDALLADIHKGLQNANNL